MSSDLHIPCITRHYFPKTAENLKKVCELAGYKVQVPENSTCCGLPYFEKGDLKSAKSAGEYNLQVYRQPQLISSSPKCSLCFQHHYPEIFNNTVSHNDAQALSRKIFSLPDLIKRIDREKLSQASGNFFLVEECCNSSNTLSILPPSELLTWHLAAIRPGCCGAGTSLPVFQHEIASDLAMTLIEEFKNSGAQAMVFEDDICRSHVSKVAESKGIEIHTSHIIDIIANAL